MQGNAGQGNAGQCRAMQAMQGTAGGCAQVLRCAARDEAQDALTGNATNQRQHMHRADL
jgi:hypothetical protein